MSNRYDLLFEPVKIGPVTAPNRFYAVPHATGHGWTQPAGAIALRGMKAEGGWGTVAVQMTEIAPDSDLGNHPMERIWDDSDIPRHVTQVEAIQKHGSLAAIELAHGGMRARNFHTGRPVMGPSSLPILRPEIPVQARAMNLNDIKAFRESHKAAALRAKKAGYDILYVYAAHDLSLLSHFLSVRTNHRTDQYGGSLENRLRLLREVLQDTLEVANDEQAVALRFSVAEPDDPVGLSHDAEGRDVVEALAELPDLWDVNIAGWPADSATARFSEEGFQQQYTSFVKSLTSKPVVGVGRFTSPDTMVALVKKRTLDLIGGARPSIADPFLPNKIKNNQLEHIRECIGCNICVSMDGYGLPIRCTQNPTISEEWRRGWHPERAVPASRNDRKSHLIIGAGPAGLECAVTLLRAGQKVTLAEANDEAGGRVTRESRLPGLSSWKRVRDYRLFQLSQSSDAELYLSSRLTATDAIEFGADSITVATGAKWRGDGVGSTSSGPIDLARWQVLTPEDVMDGVQSRPSTVIVYDDEHYYMASTVAEALAKQNHKVIYVTPLPLVAYWTDLTLDQTRIIERFNELQIDIHVNVKLRKDGQFVSTLDGSEMEFQSDHLAMIGARSSNSELFTELSKSESIGELFQCGDCLVPGIIQAAVYSGHYTAQRVLGHADIQLREQINSR